MAARALGSGQGTARAGRSVGLREMRPHGRVALVTVALGITAVVVLTLALPWFERAGTHVDEARQRYQPPLAALQQVDDGLSRAQYEFDRTVTEVDRVERILALEELRQVLSETEGAWRRFEATSLDLPGEAALVEQYEASMRRREELAGPVGYGLIIGEDTPALVTMDITRDLLRAQRDAQVAVQTLRNDLYQPSLESSLADAQAAADTGRSWVLASFSVLMGISLVVAGVAFRSARRTDQAQRVDAEHRAAEARRNEFENRLSRALEMATSEPFAFDVVAQALTEVLPGSRAELLLADATTSPFHRVLSTDQDGRGPGCRVASPTACPATHRGDRLAFASSSALDACPYLRERPGQQGALCQPVSIAGRSLGVLHATFDGELPDEEAVVALDLLARRSGDRISLLRAFAESESQARTDPLTGLLNRRSLDQAVRDLVARQVPYCVLYADLDHFKTLNDTWGHEVGDRALHLFARVLSEGVRPDDLVCRYGGEEFVVVLPACSLREAEHVIERIRASLGGMLAAAGLPAFTVSAGLASSEHAASFSAVVAMADAALLRAKAAGRDRVVVASPGPAALPSGPPA